jgi:hypothetical protein
VYLINRVKDTVKEITEAQQQATADWAWIGAMWQPPPEDAPIDVLFPPTLPSNPGPFRRLRHDQDAADAELGITLPGRRAIYAAPTGEEVAVREEVEVRAYHCTEAQAKNVQSRAQAFIKSVQDRPVVFGGGSTRSKVVYSNNDPGQQMMTWGFADSSNQNQEYGKLWYSNGWLFYFRTSDPLKIEFFPTKYLMEVATRAKTASAKEMKKKGK